jgi:hypothetical protein
MVVSSFDRNPKAISEMNIECYKKKYEEDLRERIISELSGEEKDFALYLLGEQPFHHKDIDTKQIALGMSIVVPYIIIEANIKAKSSHLHSISPDSMFYKALKDKYLKDFLSNPTSGKGENAIKKSAE